MKIKPIIEPFWAKAMCAFKANRFFINSCWGACFFTAISIFLISISENFEETMILPWVIGINFTIMVFSMNFTFVGQNLSPYREVWRKIEIELWISIGITMLLPFIPLFILSYDKSLSFQSALAILPIMIFMGITNYRFATETLSPISILETTFRTRNIVKIFSKIGEEISKDQQEFESIRNSEIKNIPMNLMMYSPHVAESNEEHFGRLIHIFEIAIKSRDIAVYRKSIEIFFGYVDTILKLEFKNLEVKRGAVDVLKHQLNTIVNMVVTSQKDIYFVEYLNSHLCKSLHAEGPKAKLFDDKTGMLAESIVKICSACLDDKRDLDFFKSVFALHIYLLKAFNSIIVEENNSLDLYNFQSLVNVQKRIGQKVISNHRTSLLYTILESVVYLGCHFAKKSAKQATLACINALVQIGREARKEKLTCFWDKCLLPPHSHAEEGIGHIMTWAYRIRLPNGEFFLKSAFETAYSRIRGFDVALDPKPELNPVFWLTSLTDSNGKPIPHVESESGMYGYSAEIDYSDYSMLKEYELHDFSSGHSMWTTPIDIGTNEDEAKLEAEKTEELRNTPHQQENGKTISQQGPA